MKATNGVEGKAEKETRKRKSVEEGGEEIRKKERKKDRKKERKKERRKKERKKAKGGKKPPKYERIVPREFVFGRPENIDDEDHEQSKQIVPEYRCQSEAGEGVTRFD